MEKDRFSDHDTAIEILSRLPVESIADLKCTSKRWLEIFSDPSFINAHFQRSAKAVSGLFVQGIIYCTGCLNYVDFPIVDYISMEKEEGCHKFCQTTLDFLPEKVSIIASCNGILLCRSFFEMIYEDHCHWRGDTKDVPMEIVLYVCNPFTKEWTTFKPKGKYEKRCCFGFAYDPYGSTLVNPAKTYARFQVVMVQPPSKLGKYPYLFRVYSSQTGTWRLSKEVCYLPNVIHPHQGCFVEGVYFWMTTGHSILTFDFKQEKSQVIPLPGPELIHGGETGMCLGVSEGDVHYVCLNKYDLMVWTLKHDISGCKWVLKHSKPAREIRHHSYNSMHMPDPLRKTDESIKTNNSIIHPYAFRDDILFMNAAYTMCTYNIKTGLIEEDLCSSLELGNLSFPPIVIPYSKSLLGVQAKDKRRPSS
ncbi:hypothetical protein AQUCO_02000505v1 [Aquilegia coerulea]|uniref:F-box domain-containing protein n=1 Tax=Aquilegia coerulea TaxID=218851 RepID=A0A2G5DHT8_AQUCA|nr:hypothetical protein AQUCO_02000505v1 [Aquilegia coerulea]